MRFIFTAIVLLFISINVFAADLPIPPKTQQLIAPATAVKKEIVSAEPSQSNTDKKYIELLERVNQQIALTWNPYNTSIAILSALFAFMALIVAAAAIASAYMIFRQGRDYKEQRESEVKNFFSEQSRLNKLALDALLSQSGEIEKRINEKFEVIDSTVANAEGAAQKVKDFEYERLKKELIQLVVERKAIQSRVKDFSGGVGATFVESDNSSMSKVHKCSHCGFGFKRVGLAMSDMFSHSVIRPNSGSVTCPKCGNVDLL